MSHSRKRIDLPREELVRFYVAERMSPLEIGHFFNCSPIVVRRRLREYGVKMRTLREAQAVSPTHGKKSLRGSDHVWWKGGTRVKCGYRMVTRPDHPEADSEGYVFEHRLVAAEKIGRPLAPNEQVHHINEIRTDNRPENLAVMTQSEHMSLHMAARHKAGKIPYHFRNRKAS